jgi:hypothetical protein
MESDELKNAWKALDNRLNENKALNETLIKEMMHSKANKSISRLIVWDIIGITISLLVIPFVVHMYFKNNNHLIFWNITMIYVALICIVAIGWYCLKLYRLTKINFSQNISHNIYNTNKYNILVTKEKIAINIIWPTLAGLIILIYAQTKVHLSLWAFLICMLMLGTIFIWLSYKKVYDKIKSILKSMNEIKELEENENDKDI